MTSRPSQPLSLVLTALRLPAPGLSAPVTLRAVFPGLPAASGGDCGSTGDESEWRARAAPRRSGGACGALVGARSDGAPRAGDGRFEAVMGLVDGIQAGMSAGDGRLRPRGSSGCSSGEVDAGESMSASDERGRERDDDERGVEDGSGDESGVGGSRYAGCERTSDV